MFLNKILFSEDYAKPLSLSHVSLSLSLKHLSLLFHFSLAANDKYNLFETRRMIPPSLPLETKAFPFESRLYLSTEVSSLQQSPG